MILELRLPVPTRPTICLTEKFRYCFRGIKFEIFIGIFQNSRKIFIFLDNY